MYSKHRVSTSWPRVLTKVNVANITLKTVTLVFRNTRKHRRIVCHQRWATVLLFMKTGDTKKTIIITKA